MTKQTQRRLVVGDCYPTAGRYVMDNHDSVLVHGTVTGQGPIEGQRIGHAWCEVGGVVIDRSNGNDILMSRDRYYEIGEIIDPVKYTHEEAISMMVDTGHFGPWEEE